MKEQRQIAALRKRTHELLEVGQPGDRLSQLFDVALIILILANIISIILESINPYMVAYQTFFIVFEIFSVAIFTVEYFARLWSSVERENATNPFMSRLRYAISPMAICDLLAILPSYVYLFVGMDLRFLRTLRLLRMFKLTRYSAAMMLLFNVLRNEAPSFCATLFILLVVMILASSGMYYVEYAAQPEAFGSIPAAMWWAVATLTTVGYGDVTPITPLGKFFGSCITIVGIGMIALPSGILASGFQEQLRRHRKQYEEHLDQILDRGLITDHERQRLEVLRRELGFTEEEAAEILQDAARHGRSTMPTHCPYCGKPLANQS